MLDNLAKANYYDKMNKMEFNNLYNKSELKILINNDLQLNMLNHAYLLCGQDEIYLNYLAKQFAKNVLCAELGCNNCSTCNKIEKNIHSDVLVYPKNIEKGIVVEDVNEIVSSAYVHPLESDKKIFILNNFNLSTIQAQNKLLKNLEEPPISSMFILTSTNPANILNTIKSRSKTINIPLLSSNNVEDFILANSTLKLKDTMPYVESSSGNLTKAIKIINDPEFISIKQLCLNIILKLKESGEILRYSSKILSYKNRVSEIFDELSLVVLDVIYAKVNEQDKVANKKYVSDFMSAGFSIKALKIIFNEILKVQEKIKCNCNVNILVDNFLITMLEVKHKWK